MKPLSSLDATFIYLESIHSPMHVGGVYLLDASSVAEDFGYERFKAHIESRLSCSSIFRQRLVEAPYNLTHPWWINDPEFNLDEHLPSYTLDSPGGTEQLMELAGRIFAEPLDRSRPLWEIVFVTGIDGIEDLQAGSFAMIIKVHHAAIDGESGAELMGALLDTSPQARETKEPDNWQPEQIPGTTTMLRHAYSQLGKKSLELGKVAGDVALGLKHVYGVQKAEKLDPPPMLLTAPKTVFNTAVTSKRAFYGVDFEFERIRKIRQLVPGATVNDVVLSICAGGIRDYLHGRDALPESPLIAMTPISVRRNEQKGQMGNQVSAMLVNLETDIADVYKRLRSIMLNTRSSKVYSQAMPANRITEFIPSETAALATRLYTRTHLGGKHRPFFNLVITNVPGPPIPLYLAGARVTHHFGMAPVLDGLGMIIVIFSYAGKISIGILSCQDVVPDPGTLGDHILGSLGELESALKQRSSTTETLGESTEETGVNINIDTSEPDSLRRFREASQELEEAMEKLGSDKSP